MAYECCLCGCKGFSNAGALASHKATSRACKLGRSRKDTDTGHDFRALVEQENSHSYDDLVNLTNHLVDDVGTSDSPRGFESVFSTPLSDFCKGSQPQSRFDSTLHLVAFIRRCRNTLGLSVKDTQKLLGLFFHPKFSLEDVHIRNVSDLQRYEAQIASDAERGWRELIMRNKDGHVPKLTPHYQDPVQALCRLFSDPRNKSGFKLSPNTEATNTYSSLDTGTWWMNMQVRTICVLKCLLVDICHSIYHLEKLWQC
jgi:hypothetical protein